MFECVLQNITASTQMQWLKDNKPLDDKLADRVKTVMEDETFKLRIDNVLESDSGIYVARALNDEGGATCTAQLVVQERETFSLSIYFGPTFYNNIGTFVDKKTLVHFQ